MTISRKILYYYTHGAMEDYSFQRGVIVSSLEGLERYAKTSKSNSCQNSSSKPVCDEHTESTKYLSIIYS